MKILLVEDSATLRAVMVGYINHAGHEAITASSGEEALQFLEDVAVDMVIMDVEMPGLDGFETTRLIRESLGSHWIPIIFVTGKDDDKSLEKGIAAGGDDYLTKPVSPVILQAKIRAMERICAMRDQLNKLNEEFKDLSQKDSLTQLYNRRAFAEKAEEHWAKAKRNQHPLTIMLLDVDHFKLYNDTYGHGAGDDCLKKVADTLKTRVQRPGDVVARYGGEEFIVIMPETDKAGAEYLAEHVRVGIEEMCVKHKASSTSKYVTVSIGATVVSYTTGTTLEEQIELADAALYHSKNRGRNCATINGFSAKHSVLVVSDDSTNIKIIDKILNGHCKVISHANAQKSAEFARSFSPDIILLDSDSIRDYRQVFEDIRAEPFLNYTPIILLGEKDDFDLTVIKTQLGAEDCLSIPINSHQLIAKINDFLTQ